MTYNWERDILRARYVDPDRVNYYRITSTYGYELPQVIERFIHTYLDIAEATRLIAYKYPGAATITVEEFF